MSQRVAVVGAGMVGLSTAWFLQEHGFDVTVHDREHVAAGSSWGNAGWLTPALTAPLPEPAVLAHGLRAVLSPASPVYVPLRPDPRLLRFLIGFARHSTARSWGLGMRAYAPMNRRALAAFDELVAGGVEVRTEAADPFLACFRTAAERDPLLEELAHIQAAGQDVKLDVLDGEEASAADPGLSSAITSAVRLHGQRYLNPPVFLDALATAVRDRGGRILEGAEVTAIEVDSGGVAVLGAEALDGDNRFDSVVIANGAWLSRLASKFGVRRLVQAGRGYSFSVSGDRLPRGPVYFPTSAWPAPPSPRPGVRGCESPG